VFAFAGDPLAIAALGLSIDENVGQALLAADTDVGSPITAVDADNPTGLIYSLVGGDGSFRIGASDGQLVAVVGANFNHEAASRQTVVVQASDGVPASPGVETGLATVTVFVRINDIDEKPASYTGANFRLVDSSRTEVTLGWSNSEYTRQFAEADRGFIQVSYGVGGFAHTVSVSSEENRVRLVDLVPGVSYAATLHWFSADGISQDTPLVAQVTAGANDAPRFDDLTYSRPENSGREQTASGTAIVTLSARDFQSDAIFYSMRGGSDAGLFAVDAQSGVVRLVRSVNFDHEGKASYTFAVVARDEYGAATVGNVVLAISDVAEAPMLPEQFAQIATVGVATTLMLRPASDPETESRTIVYQAEQTNGAELPSWLVLNQATGELTLAVSATPGTLTLRVQAVAVSPGSSLRALAGGGAVALNEPEVVNERVFKLAVAAAGSTNSWPDFARSTTDFNLVEGEYASGRSLGTVVAQDSDRLSYELRGADAGLFAINPSSGALSVREGVEFDHEGQEIYRFLVDADDGNGGLSSAEVVVQIGDVNEAPQFPAAAQTTYQVAARAMISFFVVPASDQDAGDSVTYTASLAGSWLSFDADTLAFTVQPDAPLGSHAVTLVATDADGLRAQQVLQINVAAVGNSAPSFASALMQMEYTIARRQAAVESGTGIGSIVADDPDADTLTYQIVSGDDADLFEIDESSGQIVVAAGEELTARERPYRFTVEVADGRGGIATVVVELTVQEAAAEAVADNQDKVVMLAIDRAVAVAAIDLIQARLNAPTPPTGGADLAQLADQSAPYLQLASAQQQWEDWRYEDEHETDAGERMAWRDFLHSGGFDFALDGSQSGGPQGRIWGAASRASVDGSPLADGGVVFYDGKINMVMMGAEYRTSSKRFGVAFGNSNSDLLVGEQKTIAVERKLNVVYPYLSLPISDRARMWVSAGFGSGEYMRGANMDNAAQTARDTDYLSVASGIEGNWSHELVEIDSGVKALVVRSKMDALGMSPEATGKAWRLQADFKASSSFVPVPEVALRPFVGAHLYHDGGDEWLGSNALDTSAGINLKWDRGLQAEFSSRWNADDDGEVNEERLDASISYDFGSDGRGLQLEISPRMSNSSAADNDRSLSGSASYGLPVRLFADSALATFKADFVSADRGIVVDRYGFRFAGRRLDVDLGADGAGDSWRIDLKLR
ncbi:MAG: putative Ig domain-containing protein, partial [Betaproteobacteria bacterium]|nr:putative Ig domain-containing protein [Betaproteobacteria bacterium]